MTVSKSDLETMDYGFNGQPFVFVEGNSNIDTQTMDWGFDGQPFVVNPQGGAPVVSDIKEFCGVAQASLKKVSGTAIASVKKIMGVSNT